MPSVIQRSDSWNNISENMAKLAAKTLKIGPGEEESNQNPHIILRMKQYSATKTNYTQTSAAVMFVVCEQKNLTLVRCLLEVLHGKYFQLGFKEFVSTTCNMDQWCNMLVEHIEFIKDKKYFYVSGLGLDNVEKSMFLSDAVTFNGKITTLSQLHGNQGIFAFMQKSKSGSCKIICQHAATHTVEIKKNNTVTTFPKTWFVEEIIKKECNGWT
jgi:hypothetical protein